MSEDVFIKNVLFGGFNKEEVLKYIEKIQKEYAAEVDRIKQKDDQTDQLRLQVKQLEEQLASEHSRFAALASLNDEYCERIYSLEEQIKEQNKNFESIQEDCNRFKNLESQIGALLVDAVLYSDKMTAKAKQAATIITADAKQTLVATAEDVDILRTEITQISGDFQNDISLLVEKVENFSSRLASFAGRFEIESDANQEKIDSEQEIFAHFIAQRDNNTTNDETVTHSDTPESNVNTEQTVNETDSSEAEEETEIPQEEQSQEEQPQEEQPQEILTDEPSAETNEKTAVFNPEENIDVLENVEGTHAESDVRGISESNVDELLIRFSEEKKQDDADKESPTENNENKDK